MQHREFVTILCAAVACSFAARATAVAVTLIAMTVFGSTAFAQQAQPPRPSWTGRFEWTHICVGGGNRDETRGVSDLTLDHDGRGNLTGTLAGSTPERAQTIPPCSFTYVAPGTFSAKLVGSYTPGQNTFSAQAAEVQTTPGRASWACPAGSNATVTDQTFFRPFEGPMFQDAFRDLRRQPDGSLKSSGESTFSAGGGTCTTTYSLTLRGGCSRDPELSSGHYTREPFGPETPADIAPPCEQCPGGTLQLKNGEVTFRSSQHEEQLLTGIWLHICPYIFLAMHQIPTGCMEKKLTPQCVYTYEAIWLCTATGNVRKTTKTKVEEASCIPRG